MRLLGTLVVVLLVLTVLAFVVGRLARTDRGRDFARDFAARTRGWWIVVLLFVPALLAGGWLVVALFAATALLAWHEFSTITGAAALRSRDVAWTAPAVAAVFAAAASLLPVLPTLALAFLWVAAFGAFTRYGPGADAPATSRAGWRLLGFSYCVISLAAAAAVAVRYHPHWLFFSAVVVQVSDVLQYVFGKLFGKHPLAPKLSPKKTWEGLLGGLVGAALLAGAMASLVGLSFGAASVLGFALALTGVAGGLAMSAVKRHHGAKDFSQLLPGHGGLMDRLDSVCAASLVTLAVLAA